MYNKVYRTEVLRSYMFGKIPDGHSSFKDQLKDLYDELKSEKSESVPSEEMAAQKAASDKAHVDKTTADQLAINNAAVEMERVKAAKIISELFFSLMMEALHKKSHFKENLSEAAEKVGFTQLSVALNKVVNSDGQSPLQYLIQKQDFEGAQALIDSGAVIGPVEQAVLDIASDSKAGREFGLSAPPVSEKLHPVKYFGLVLGIEMTSKDGVTYSQYGHIAPTYQLMTDTMAKHAQKNPGNQDFKDIAEAFNFSNKSAAFSNSTPQRNPEAGREMSARIQSGKLTTIPISCDGHAMGLSVVPDGPGSKSGYLVYTNRGLGANPNEYGTQIYRVDDINKVNPAFINNMMNGFHNGTSHDAIKHQIAQITDGKEPIHTIQQKGQKVDNCTIANSSSNVHGMLLCQQAVKKGGFDKIDKADMNLARDEYKKFKADMKADKVNELVNAITKNPNDSDLINLGKGFLNKKNADPSLKAQVEKALGPHMGHEAKSEPQHRTELRI